MEHERCYVFSLKNERPNKRRRVEASGLDQSWPLREQTYRELWGEQQERVKEVLDDANKTTFVELLGFLEANRKHETSSKLPCGLILAGPSIAAHAIFFDQLSKRIASETAISTFSLITSTDSPNLKSLLKVLITSATTQTSLDDEDEELVSRKRKGPKLLNYDLQLLYEWVVENGVDQVVVAFRDSEAFDSSVLSETIELLG
jgi:origin recognition complex subunit 3